jgi:hypothetical protein
MGGWSPITPLIHGPNASDLFRDDPQFLNPLKMIPAAQLQPCLEQFAPAPHLGAQSGGHDPLHAAVAQRADEVRKRNDGDGRQDLPLEVEVVDDLMASLSMEPG